MTIQLTADDLLRNGYSGVYRSLNALREAFHSSGRLDDSNAKLDEVAKLFATYLAYKRGHIPSFPEDSHIDAIPALRDAFQRAAGVDEYRLPNGVSIFGRTPELALQDGDDLLASELIRLVRSSVDLAFDMSSSGTPFDVLNEAFGHFVRDNFRSNIEDAQYMTPPEVVDFMAEMALHDLQHDGLQRIQTLTVLDPTCGVGSFLTAVYHRVRRSHLLDPARLRLFGQDKVERMARMATLNLHLFDVRDHQITVGNSLRLGSPIDRLNDGVDLILTNPPFGARFDRDTIGREFKDNTPFFARLRHNGTTIDSELLFIDRNLRLLRDGGRLLIVVPDGVVSARGVASMLRHHLSHHVTVRGLIELPSVTFAQAGTRTKTAILYLQKVAPRANRTNRVFVAVARDLGFLVGSRKGVQVKSSHGTNELLAIMGCYRTVDDSACTEPLVLNTEPSVVVVPSDLVLTGSWTPNHYNAARFDAVRELANGSSIEVIPLDDLVEFVGDSRRMEVYRPGSHFISVLHVLGDGLLDLRALNSYAPKTPGVRVNPGEILLSRINPRIPRVCIVPDFGGPTLCSSEFEVMRPRVRIDGFALAYLLQTKAVQEQITSLTSGTSASHNRIRTSDLARIMVPVPVAGTGKAAILDKVRDEYEQAVGMVVRGAMLLAELRTREQDLFGR